MVDEAGYSVAEALQEEVRQFLRAYPVPDPSRKLDDYGAKQLDFGRKHRQALATAYEKSLMYIRRLRTSRGLLKGHADLLKEILERRDKLKRELERFQVDGLGRAEKIFFEKEGIDFQPRLGKQYKASKRPSERLPEHLKEK